MNEMLERVAKAMHNHALNAPLSEGVCEMEKWEALEDYQREGALALARAAIEALREPTSEMVHAGAYCEYRTTLITRAKDIYGTMIEEALKG